MLLFVTHDWLNSLRDVKSSSSSDAPVAQKKEPSAADVKAEKAAAKAAQKAARERQQAAVEAGAAANK